MKNEKIVHSLIRFIEKNVILYSNQDSPLGPLGPPHFSTLCPPPLQRVKQNTNTTNKNKPEFKKVKLQETYRHIPITKTQKLEA